MLLLFFCFVFSDLSRIVPFDQFLIIGQENARISCNSVSKANWTHNGENRLPNHAILKNNELIIPRISMDTFGYYECTGTNEVGQMFTAFSFIWNEFYKSIIECN